jgi:TonB family protein
MVYSRSPIPFSRGSAKPRVFLHNIAPDTFEPLIDDSRTALVFDGIRHQIESGANIVDILNSAARAAQDLTSATGAAIAMGRDGLVLCVGRSGETAPELGAAVSVDAGISGECMRTGKVLICDDTQLDSRVDAEVCLSLGLRSLAAVPLQPSEMQGLLEVFSNYPANFSREHVAILKGVAGLVELAYARISVEAAAEAVVEEPSIPTPAVTVDESLPEPRAIEWLRDSQENAGERKFPYWTVPLVLTLVLLAFRGWMAWHQPAKVSVSPFPAVSQEAPLRNEVAAKASPKASPPPSHVAPRHRALQPESSETPDVVVRNFNEAQSAEGPADNPKSAGEASNEAPQLPVLSANNAVLGSLVANEATMPKVAMKVSQGVVRGNIIHRVPPVYPPDALYQGLSGPVVLRATINEGGAVERVTTISGSAVLARAAEDAVKKWRYQPSLLNGTPVKVETEITVNFKRP